MMRGNARVFAMFVFSILIFFGAFTIMESSAWARAGRGGSFGSRGSRSYTAPKAPSSPSQSSPGYSTPGRSTLPGANQPSSGFFSRSPFMQGLAGGLAGGMLGSLLFGGMGHAAGGGMVGGGIGLLDIVLIGLLLYLGYRFFKKRRQNAFTAAPYGHAGYSEPREFADTQTHFRQSQHEPSASASDLERGFQQIRQYDPSFGDEAFKETIQDIFFRIQAAWMNRSPEGIENMITNEMAGYFKTEFEAMRQSGRTNRLENIAVRKVEPTEAWQEAGKDYVTVLFTANLLDYTVDDATGQVVEGDRANPVKFREFWTFCRDIGSRQWKLTAIHQAEDNR